MTRLPVALWAGAAVLLAAPSAAASQPSQAGQAAAERAVPVDAVTRWRPYSREASQRFGVPLDWIERVMRAESGGRTHLHGRPITSRAGAMGLMQIMPGTWAELRARLRLGADPHDPRANILAGTFYLRLMYDRFGYPGLFGAYNAGPARYAAWLADGRPLPAETRAYLAQVGAGGEPAAAPEKAPQRATLFVIERADPAGAAAPQSAPTDLFVTLSTRPPAEAQPQWGAGGEGRAYPQTGEGSSRQGPA
ncbi:lytic transglycosylase domain-containing protein [Sphingomonas sp.]|uniref:lytic transglycosylase domain-containing protein n=1 Tax=Sphingomonas sp. TaxID=28214 RepID=UPI0031DB0D1B